MTCEIMANGVAKSLLSGGRLGLGLTIFAVADLRALALPFEMHWKKKFRVVSINFD